MPTGGAGASQAGRVSSDRALLLSKFQKPIAAAFGEYLQPRIGEGLPAYTGPLYEPLSPEQIAMLDRMGAPEEAMRETIPSVAQAYQTALTGAPTPGFGAGEIDRYLGAQRTAATRTFEEETMPGIREAYRGPGTYWGGVRAKAEERARTGFEVEMAAREGEARLWARQYGISLEEAAKNRQMGAAGAAFSAYQQAIQGTIMGQDIQRQDKERQYQIDYQQWMQGLAEMSPVINQILSFLGVPMSAVSFYEKGVAWGAGIGFGQDAPIPGQMSTSSGQAGGAGDIAAIMAAAGGMP